MTETPDIRTRTAAAATQQYDAIGAQWENARELPTVYPERSSFRRLLGDVRGAEVLDLACGDGFYTRQVKQWGARRALGVDISPAMVDSARAIEQRAPLGVEYLVADAAQPDLSELGSHDLVLAAYLVNYARSEEELTDMCRAALSALAPGGRFVGVTQRPGFSFRGPRPDPYGFTFTRQRESKLGTHIKVTAALQPPISFETCLIRPEVYERAFAAAGFGELTWVAMTVGEEGEQRFGTAFWEGFLANPPIVMFEARR
ncbi:class I SAM-dependent methyltransferase [Streptomyces sp. NPDC021212]|uniref:class I SAM-dependent methyltransferase n=1 Tax=Streptomyces sp. NPDC021212 TaxID=3365118 RepID=UPI0037B5BD83